MASSPLKLVIGNKAYSSWSLRPWLLLAHLHVPFEEVVINIYDEKGRRAMRRHAPTGKVPVLYDGDLKIWESLAIMEYLAEKYPAKNIWPKAKAARAHARVLCSEMHAGFMAMRQEMPTNFRREPKAIALSDAAQADIKRVEAAWVDARKRFGKGGPFLFGRFCAADAMFAPVVNRLYAYDVKVKKATRDYMKAIMALPAWNAWHADGAQEIWHNEAYDFL